MNLINKLRGEFVDIIEWLEDSRTLLAWRFPRYQNEIKQGAQLIVREGQLAIFVYQGQLGDVFGPGTYTLNTQNLPIMSTIQGWKYGFNSPFKAEVYFINTRQFLDLKWGTSNPVMMRDTDFGMIRLRAFGIYSFRVQDPVAFLREVFGTSELFTTEGVEGQVKRLIVSSLSDMLAQSKIPALDLAANYDELSQYMLNAISPRIAPLGLKLDSFVIENISLPEEVEKAMDRRTSMGVVGDMNRYAQFQSAEAIREAANNPGGGARLGAGMGAGMAMGQMMHNAFQQPAQQAAPQQAVVPCVSCQKPIAPGSRFCPECGAAQQKAAPVCKACNAPLNEGAKFCPACGEQQ